jgi:hypothetical protein
MTEQFALDYIPHRMRELGHNAGYITRFQHLILRPREIINLECYGGEIWLLVDPTASIRVESELGRYNMRNIINANKQVYEHQGSIEIANLDAVVNHVRFIQVVPKHDRKEK